MFRKEIADILNKNKPVTTANSIDGDDTYYFLYKINPDESLVKVDRDDIEDVANRISEALSPYNIDEGELLLPYKIVVYEFFNDCLAIKEYDCTYKASNINVIFDYVSMRRTKTYGADSIRLIYFDNLAVVTKMKNGRFISLPISMPIDYLQRIKLTKEWKHIKDNLEKSSLNVTILDSEHLLAEEGKHMKNCVRSYYDFVKSGSSFIN